MSVKVAIVGAGVGGLSLAIALRRIGVEARVFEQSPVIGDVGAGIGPWPGPCTAWNASVLPNGSGICRSAPSRGRRPARRMDDCWWASTSLVSPVVGDTWSGAQIFTGR